MLIQVITRRWPLLILWSPVGIVCAQYFGIIHHKVFIFHILFVIISWWSQLILGSLGQRSWSQGALNGTMVLFPLIILKTIYYKVFIFHILINHYAVDTSSKVKVKVTEAFNVIFFSTHYLDNYLILSLYILHIDLL
jgi:hypothetical protein